MGHATLWPVPRAIDAEAHHYPRHWKRNMFFLYGSALMMVLQVNRYAWICRVSIINHLSLIAIIDEKWRVHGLGISRRRQESQILLRIILITLNNII